MLAKTRPQRYVQACSDCEGQGQTTEAEFDGSTRLISCETCCGCGDLSDCVMCDEPTPISVLEMFDGRCGACVAAKEMAS